MIKVVNDKALTKSRSMRMYIHVQHCDNCGARLSDLTERRCVRCGFPRPDKTIGEGNRIEQYDEASLCDDVWFIHDEHGLNIRTSLHNFDPKGKEIQSDAIEIRQFLVGNYVNFEEVEEPGIAVMNFRISSDHKARTWANAISYGCVIQAARNLEIEIAVTKQSGLPETERITTESDLVRKVLRIQRGAFAWGKN